MNHGLAGEMNLFLPLGILRNYFSASVSFSERTNMSYLRGKQNQTKQEFKGQLTVELMGWLFMGGSAQMLLGFVFRWKEEERELWHIAGERQQMWALRKESG